MPLYEYSCRVCEQSFEALVFDGEPIECPKCGGDNLDRLFSLPARPRVGPSALPVSNCEPDRPPCGPGCCRM